MDESTLENKPDNNIKQALAELEPKWRSLDELHVYEWAWEFLRRNPEYIHESAEIDGAFVRRYEEIFEILYKNTATTELDLDDIKKFLRMNTSFLFRHR